jgi:hypothetical protein
LTFCASAISTDQPSRSSVSWTSRAPVIDSTTSSGRFGVNRGVVGFLVCRTVSDKDKMAAMRRSSESVTDLDASSRRGGGAG